MTELVATTPGLYPLPDWAKDSLSDLKGHQKHDLISGDENEDILAVYDDVRGEVISHQNRAGLDYIVEGQARWDDMIAHPLAVHENVETRGIVRYYDNNNFYRDPVIIGDLTESGDIGTELDAAARHTDALQAVIPGPYSLADLSTNEYYDDDSTLIEAIGRFLGNEVRKFPTHQVLFLLEPSLAVTPPQEGLGQEVSEAIDGIARATDAQVIVHTYWGSIPEKVYAHILDAEIDAIGYDLISDGDGNLSNIEEYGTKDSIALGIIDGQNTWVESPETVSERIKSVDAHLPVQDFERIYLTVNTELFYLPVNKYLEKLETLATAVSSREVIQ